MDILGPEPEDKAQPRTNVRVVRGLHATTDQKLRVQVCLLDRCDVIKIILRVG